MSIDIAKATKKDDKTRLPLEGLLVVDASQFLAGPLAALRLQDLGARVIKIERAETGDLARQLYFSDTVVDNASTVFHAINRGKESIALNLKTEGDKSILRALVAKADVFLQNFRPGVIERLGFAYKQVQAINSKIVYGTVSGYGEKGDWSHLPGQDLLAQARSGIMWLNGKASDGPVPVGLPVADIMAGSNLAQGVLAAIVQRGITDEGALVETSLLESIVDLQFEMLTTHLNDGGRLPNRGEQYSAHAGLSAPYGVYPTTDGYIAIAMNPLVRIADSLELPDIAVLAQESRGGFTHREHIEGCIAKKLSTDRTRAWTDLLESHGIWCAPVLNWRDLLKSDAMKQFGMVREANTDSGNSLRLLGSPIRVNGERGMPVRTAPSFDADRHAILAELSIPTGTVTDWSGHKPTGSSRKE